MTQPSDQPLPKVSGVDALVADAFAVPATARATGRGEAEVRRLLQDEVASPGSNVAAEIQRRGVTPYVWSDELLAFYSESDAFIFELVVWNRQRFKRSMRAWTRQCLKGEAERIGRPLRVLCHGDGLGVDAASLALDGHQVSYFEFPGPSQRYAKLGFEAIGVDVTVLEGEEDGDNFDAVTCFDVLEHVPDPRRHVHSLADRLSGDGGLLLAHAPFYLIAPPYPTHLAANRRYAGRLSLYEKAGFELIDANALWNPLALRLRSTAGRVGAGRRLWLKTVGGLLSAGRLTSLPYLPVQAAMRRLGS